MINSKKYLSRTFSILFIFLFLFLFIPSHTRSQNNTNVNSTVTNEGNLSNNSNTQVTQSSGFMSGALEIIKALGDAWITFLIFGVAIFFLFYKKDIGVLIKRIANDSSTLKVAGTEVMIQKKEELIEKKESDSDEKAQPPEVLKETSEIVLELESLDKNEESGEKAEDLFYNLLTAKTYDDLELAFKELQNKESDDKEKLINEAWCLRIRYKLGDFSAIDKLEKLASNKNVSSFAYSTIAYIYENTNNVEKSIEYFKLSIKHEQEESEKVKSIVKIAQILHRVGSKDEAFSFISKNVGKINNLESLSELYKGLANLYKKDKNLELQTLALEKAIEHKPNDTDSLFQIAYAYNKNKQQHLSILYYKILLTFTPDYGTAFNNLGVDYDEVNMPIYSVRNYQKAAELGETLASANLAYRLINAGFADNAKEILNEAKVSKETHENVGSAIADLVRKEEAEEKRYQKIIDLAVQHQQFYRRYSEAYFVQAEEKISLSGNWVCNQESYIFDEGWETTIEQKGDEIQFDQSSESPIKRFKGKIKNLSVKIQKLDSNLKDGEAIFNTVEANGFAIISKDQNQIDIYFNRDVKEIDDYVSNLEDPNPIILKRKNTINKLSVEKKI